LNFLLNKITQLQASSINALVESVYLDLREHKVKKTAIEAKLREVGEKCKEKRVWIVKSALPVSIVPRKLISKVMSSSNSSLKRHSSNAAMILNSPYFT
jgi:hypothetical protein